MFEGPGQGAVLREYGIPLDYVWEKPTSTILDYFELDDVTLIGFSMGGWMCFRAAAFEPRIKRVIASSIAYDYMKIPPKVVADFARWMLKHHNMFNKMTNLKMKFAPQEKWGIDNLMFITMDDDPWRATQVMLAFNEENLQSARVTQDVLILTGEEDHFIPMKLHHLQVAALTNAHSVTPRVFTRAEQAQNHCQIGNIGLAVDTMAQWLAEKEPVLTSVRS
jgi:pimeloyl-ACP methyl ester carboxylesterase